MAEIVVAIAAKCAECLVAPIRRQLGFLSRYRRHIYFLSMEVEKLMAMRRDVQRAVEEAIRRGDEIRRTVLDWLTRADEITVQAAELMENMSRLNGWCPNLMSRYQLSRQAQKMAQVIVEIQMKSRFESVSYRAPPQNVIFKNYEPLESRALTLNKIMDALRDDEMEMIGVWGMGGVGKTTLLKQVSEQAMQEMLFTTQVYISASWTLDSERIQQGIFKIQQKIADVLGLQFEGRDESTRAAELMQRLKKQRTLIILDDIWKEVDLGEVGIPSKDGQKECKIVLASRDRHLLCKDMGAQKYFPVEQLPLEEAWNLFKERAGDSLEKNLKLRDIAIEVVKECEGLPIAIVTIAKVLKDQSVAIWKNALEELKRSAPTNIRGMVEVHSILKLSYNHLIGDEVKSLFLLCGMGGDGDISMDHLLKYGMGLGLFACIDSLKQARNRLVTLVKILKDSSLLLDVDEDGQSEESSSLLFEYDQNKFVRMHRFVWDVARAIASEDPRQFVVKEALQSEEWSTMEEFRECTGILLKCRDIRVLSDGLVCPKLELFLLNSNDSSSRIPHTFFNKMEKLKVLDLSKMCLTPLPSSLHFLQNLRTLCLDHCQLGDIAIIGELKKLQILSFVSSKIEQLPKEMMQLIDLRLLDLRNCSYLKVIPQNVISSLSRLEYLCMENSFTQWEVEGFNGGESNVCLSELKHLPFLRALDVKISDPNMLPPDMLFDNLTRYRILVGDHWKWHHTYKASRMLKLSEFKSLHLVNCFSKLLRRTEDLELKALNDTIHVVKELDMEGFLELKHLHIHDSPGIQYIINSMNQWVSSRSALPILEELHLRDLINLDAVCHGPIPVGCFCNLRILQVGSCENLKYLLVLPTEQGREQVLPQLRSLSLEDLPKLSNFYSTGTTATQGSLTSMLDAHTPFFDQQVALPALEYLCMDKLNNVRILWQNQLTVFSFCKLERLYIRSCESLEVVFDITKGIHPLRESGLYYQGSPGFLTFQNLHSVEVISCPCLKYLFPASVAKGLVQLEFLEIVSCGVEEIVANENGNEAPSMILFPKLASLTLTDLGKLRCFYRGMHASGWPLLKQLKVKYCHNLEILASEVDINPISQSLLLVQMFPFHMLEVLQIFNMENITKIWQDQLPTIESFGKLKEITVSHCRNLPSVFPTSVIQGLVQLEILEIDSCGMKEIFAEEDDLEKPNRFIFPKLINLTLKNLKELKSFYPGKYISEWPLLKRLEVCNCDNIEILFQEIGLEGNIDNQVQQPFFLVEKLAFPKLEVLDISQMENIKKIWHGQLSTKESFGNLKQITVSHCRNLSSVFPTSVIQGLFQLETLEVDSCGMEEIFVKEDGIETPIGVMLPKLTYLTLKNLKELRCFYPGKHISKWPLLKKLEVCNCDKVDILFQEKGLEGNIDNQIQQPFFLVEKLSFPKLEVLEIFHMENIKKIWHDQLSTIEIFGHLKEIRVSHCRNLLSVFPTSVIRGLLQLETLEIDSCGMEETCTKEDGIETLVVVIFPKLTYLTLKNLKELKCFYPGKHISAWPLLKKLEVCNCDKLEILFQEKESNLDNPVQQTFFLVKEVAFPSLEDLDISNLDNVEKIWHKEFIADSFGKLKRLSVRSCQKLQNVIPSNMLKRLPSIQILKIVDCNSVEEVFNLEAIDSKESHDIPALQLRELCLDNLKNLKRVWNKAPQGLLTYQNLNRVQVSHCPRLKIPFPGYVVRSLLQVKEVNMKSSGVEEIVAHEDLAEGMTMFLFSEVTSLTNSCLEELKCFYLGLHTLEWPMLKTLKVESHDSLEKLACKLDKPVGQPIFLCDKVTFPNLEFLNLSFKLKEIQDLHVLFGALSNLKILIVENCPFLLSLFSPQFIQCLNNLKKLTVKKCDLLEEVFDLKGLEHVDMLSKLEEVSLIDLPQLKSICNNSPPQVLCFQNLKLLQVKQCNSVTYLFSPSMALGLVQLQDLRIEDCPTMKEIVTAEDRYFDNQPQRVSCFQNLKSLQVKQCDSLMYLFSSSFALALAQLQDLCIEHCNKMEEIVREDRDMDNRHPQVSCFKNLKSVQVKQCDSLMYLFSSSFALALAQLQDLCIEHCNKMEEIVREDRDRDNRHPQVSCFKNLKSVQVKQCDSLMYLFSSSFALALAQLQDLRIEHCNKMEEIVREDRDMDNRHPKVSCFKNLKFVQVKQCNSLMYLFSPSFALALVQLQDLCIEHCSTMKEIVREDGDMDNSYPQVSCFKNLKFVQVKQCDNLMHLFSSSFALGLVQLQDLCIEHCYTMEEIVNAKGVTDEIIFPQITRVSLLKLPKLTSFYLSQTLKKIRMGDSNTAPGVLFNEEVAFPNLEFLYVSGLDNVKKIWHNQLHENSFSKLKEMKVENCNELKNISTSNVLKWLPSLEFLRIASCGKFQEVFDLDVTNVQEDVTDNRLSQLVLDDLQNLEHICDKVLGKKLCLQNLKYLEVRKCGTLNNIFSPYTALGLVPLEGMKEIITQEGAEEVIDKIEFPELTSLSLESLPSLASFYPGPGDLDILSSVLFNEKVAFPSLESLDICGLGNMKKIWHNKLIENSFSKLKDVKVENCNELQNVLASNVLIKWLPSLHFLRIARCDQLKEVFDLEGAGDILEDVKATQLNHLILQDLPQLQHIWNKDPYGILTFHDLDLVEVLGFHGLKSHFPAGSLVRDLSQLEKQLIRSRRPEDFGNNERKDFLFPEEIIRFCWTEDLGEKDEGEDFVFPEVTYDKLLDVRKNKGKEVVKVHDYVSEISEDIPGSSG